MHHVQEDDGFNDFLDEEEAETTLEQQEIKAIHRQIQTVGIRQGIEQGKEETLQCGFDHGFESAAKVHFRRGLLRGALWYVAYCDLRYRHDGERDGLLAAWELTMAYNTNANAMDSGARANGLTQGLSVHAREQVHALIDALERQTFPGTTPPRPFPATSLQPLVTTTTVTTNDDSTGSQVETTCTSEAAITSEAIESLLAQMGLQKTCKSIAEAHQ